jgi:hypothetical protein
VSVIPSNFPSLKTIKKLIELESSLRYVLLNQLDKGEAKSWLDLEMSILEEKRSDVKALFRQKK